MPLAKTATHVSGSGHLSARARLGSLWLLPVSPDMHIRGEGLQANGSKPPACPGQFPALAAQGHQ
eukprot:5165075-Amphidinium_carterae.1